MSKWVKDYKAICNTQKNFSDIVIAQLISIPMLSVRIIVQKDFFSHHVHFLGPPFTLYQQPYLLLQPLSEIKDPENVGQRSGKEACLLKERLL